MRSAEEDLERWRAIPGHACYDLSDHGRVRSWKKWLGCTQDVPRILTVLERSGRRSIQLGLHGGCHDVDVLMHDVWDTPIVIREKDPWTWRRVMLSDKKHSELIAMLETVDSEPCRRMIRYLRMAKKVEWEDEITASEFGVEET